MRPNPLRTHVSDSVYIQQSHGFGFRGLGFKLSSMRVRSGEVCTTSLGTMAEIGCDPASLSFCVPRLLPSLDSHLSAFGVGGTGGSP